MIERKKVGKRQRAPEGRKSCTQNAHNISQNNNNQQTRNPIKCLISLEGKQQSTRNVHILKQKQVVITASCKEISNRAESTHTKKGNQQNRRVLSYREHVCTQFRLMVFPIIQDSMHVAAFTATHYTLTAHSAKHVHKDTSRLQ